MAPNFKIYLARIDGRQDSSKVLNMTTLPPYKKYAIVALALVFGWFSTFMINGIEVNETSMYCLKLKDKANMDLCSKDIL